MNMAASLILSPAEEELTLTPLSVRQMILFRASRLTITICWLKLTNSN